MTSQWAVPEDMLQSATSACSVRERQAAGSVLTRPPRQLLGNRQIYLLLAPPPSSHRPLRSAAGVLLCQLTGGISHPWKAVNQLRMSNSSHCGAGGLMSGNTPWLNRLRHSRQYSVYYILMSVTQDHRGVNQAQEGPRHRSVVDPLIPVYLLTDSVCVPVQNS